MPNRTVAVTDVLDAALRAISWAHDLSGGWCAVAAPTGWNIAVEDVSPLRRQLLRTLEAAVQGNLLTALCLSAHRGSRGLMVRLTTSQKLGSSPVLPAAPWIVRQLNTPDCIRVSALWPGVCNLHTGPAPSPRRATLISSDPQRAFVPRRVLRALGMSTVPPLQSNQAFTASDSGIRWGATQLTWPLLIRDVQAAGFGAAASQGRRILVAEDSAPNRLVMKLMLERLGYDVTCVCDGREAVEAMAQGTFDAVLLDISMPNMNGLEAIRHMRAAGASDTPIIALSGRSSPEEIAEIEAATFSERLLKPVASAQLALSLRRHLSANNKDAVA